MALENRSEGNYITIYDGKFSQRVPEGTEGAVRRINKNGKEVFEKYYDSFTGKLVNIQTKDGAYGKSWIFSFVDKGDVYQLQLNYSNSFATQFLKILPNIDLTKEMKVSPSVKIDEAGKKKSSLFVNQDGNALKHAYTRDNPNGLPPMDQVKVKGVMQWDDSAQLAYLEEMVNRDILPKLPKTATVSATDTTDELAGMFETATTSDENDY